VQPFGSSEELTQLAGGLARRPLGCHLEQPSGRDAGEGVQESQGRCQ
jgi:hypothetical protein